MGGKTKSQRVEAAIKRLRDQNQHQQADELAAREAAHQAARQARQATLDKDVDMEDGQPAPNNADTAIMSLANATTKLSLETVTDALTTSHGMLRTRLDEQADIIIRQAKKIVELSTETLELKEDLDELNAFCDETEKLIVQHREEKAGLHQRVEDLERKLEIQDEKIEYLMNRIG